MPNTHLATVPLFVPGWRDSGPDHWQTHWQAELAGRRVRQVDWEATTRAAWVLGLQRAIDQIGQPVLLIGHSLGCIAIAHRAAGATGAASSRGAAQPSGLVRGALLVAPADVERSDAPAALRDFAPVPLKPLPFTTVVVGSTNDPYCGFIRAGIFARGWGAKLLSLGDAGHINGESGHTRWRAGLTLLKMFDEQHSPGAAITG